VNHTPEFVDLPEATHEVIHKATSEALSEATRQVAHEVIHKATSEALSEATQVQSWGQVFHYHI